MCLVEHKLCQDAREILNDGLINHSVIGVKSLTSTAGGGFVVFNFGNFGSYGDFGNFWIRVYSRLMI